MDTNLQIQFIYQELKAAESVLHQFIQNQNTIPIIQQAAHLMANSLLEGGQIMSCGNGGSMSDAMHFAEELSGRYRNNRPALAAMAISDAGHLSCVANDFGYPQVFARSVEALGKTGDVLLAISTSGNSENVILAAEQAIAKNMKVIALTGKDGGKLGPLAHVEIRAPQSDYADRVQEIHIKVIHILIGLIEQSVFK